MWVNKLGNALAGFENVPPMRGLPSQFVKRFKSMGEISYPMIEPTGQARPKIGNAMDWFVESVISPNTE